MEYLLAPDRLETPEFTLRNYRPGDGPLLGEAVNQSYEHLHPYMPWARPHQSDEESERWVRQSCGHYLLSQNFNMAIFSPDGGRLLGGTGFHHPDLPDRNAEVGMWIRADAAGKGLGTRVLVALLSWGFEAWPWLRITWLCDATNIASARTATRAGMRQEACLRRESFSHISTERRDTLIFAALKEEWTAPHL